MPLASCARLQSPQRNTGPYSPSQYQPSDRKLNAKALHGWLDEKDPGGRLNVTASPENRRADLVKKRLAGAEKFEDSMDFENEVNEILK